MTKISLYAATTLSVALLTSALPRNQVYSRSPLADAVLIGYDHETREFHGYNERGFLGSIRADHPTLGKREDPPKDGLCQPLTSDKVNANSQAKGAGNVVPGQQHVDDVMKDLFGDPQEIHTNPATEKSLVNGNSWDLPNLQAWMCLTDPIVKDMQMDGNPDCGTNSQDVSGNFTGTNGTYAANNIFSESTSATHTVTNSEEVSIGYDFETEIDAPFGIGKAKQKFSFGFKYSHDDSKATTDTNTQTLGGTLTYQQRDGQSCHATVNTTVCQYKTKGDITQTVGGYVWYHYGDKKKSPNDDAVKKYGWNWPQDGNPSPLVDGTQDRNGHYSWVVKYNMLLKGDDLVIKTPFTSLFKDTYTDTTYDVTCNDGFKSQVDAQSGKVKVEKDPESASASASKTASGSASLSGSKSASASASGKPASASASQSAKASASGSNSASGSPKSSGSASASASASGSASSTPSVSASGSASADASGSGSASLDASASASGSGSAEPSASASGSASAEASASASASDSAGPSASASGSGSADASASASDSAPSASGSSDGSDNAERRRFLVGRDYGL